MWAVVLHRHGADVGRSVPQLEQALIIYTQWEKFIALSFMMNDAVHWSLYTVLLSLVIVANTYVDRSAAIAHAPQGSTCLCLDAQNMGT